MLELKWKVFLQVHFLLIEIRITCWLAKWSCRMSSEQTNCMIYTLKLRCTLESLLQYSKKPGASRAFKEDAENWTEKIGTHLSVCYRKDLQSCVYKKQPKDYNYKVYDTAC